MYADDLTSKEINIVPFTGYYKNENEFIKDAVNTLLSARKDLRIAMLPKYIVIQSNLGSIPHRTCNKACIVF